MPKTRMRDVIILLPGITGSVLEKHGRPLWGVSGSVLWAALRRPEALVEGLQLRHDDQSAEDLGDGVRATSLIEGLQLIPGLVKIVDGYGGICDAIARNFHIVPGTPGSARPANFFRFPYDWRRDNRFTARRLQRLMETAVTAWRTHTSNPGAKAILIAHSMGGLIARYCLEVLEAWPLCKALITFGTPFRGSPQALEYLSNGYRRAGVDLTAALRTCTAVYQLLPMYPAVRVRDAWLRAGEITDIPEVQPDRAAAALAFYREIEAAEERPKPDGGYLTVPIIGTDQPTNQSAVLEPGRLTVARNAPDGMDPLLWGGDGTVPLCSAIPLSLSTAAGWPQAAETHGALQNQKALLATVRHTLTQLQIRGLAAIRGDAAGPPAAAPKAGIELEAEDVYLASEPVVLTAAVHRSATGDPGLVATVRSDSGYSVRKPFTMVGEAWRAEFSALPADIYHVLVEPTAPDPARPDPVHGLFAVA
jgi:hypothetical protein